MRNRFQTRKYRITVCLIERNGLAASYLREILGCEPRIRILSDYSVLGSPTVPGDSRLIFAIDIDTLSRPLVDCLTILRSNFPAAKLLLLGKKISTDDLRRVPFLGIEGFVSHGDVKDQLVPAIQAISGGQKWFAPEVFEEFLAHRRLKQSEGCPMKEGQEIFTPREKLVIGLIERRLGNKEISAMLRISESTVKFHLSNIFRKLKVNDRLSAVEAAVILVPKDTWPSQAISPSIKRSAQVDGETIEIKPRF